MMSCAPKDLYWNRQSTGFSDPAEGKVAEIETIGIDDRCVPD